MRKKLTLLSITIFSIFNVAHAQNWGGGIDEKDFNWGFSFQYIASEYKIIRSQDWRKPYFDVNLNKYVTDSLVSISSPLSAGFGIGFVMNFRMNENLDIRSTPSFAFCDRLVDYKYLEPAVYNTSTSAIQKKVQSVMFELPVGLKLKSDRRGNFRAYILMGGKYSINMTAGKKDPDAASAPYDKLLKNQKSFLSYEGGLGFDLYFEYFKMSPEIKLSYAVKDILRHEDHPYATPIDKAMLRNFTFSLFFE